MKQADDEEDTRLLEDATGFVEHDEPARSTRWTLRRKLVVGLGLLAALLVGVAVCLRPIAQHALATTGMTIRRMQLASPTAHSAQLTTQLEVASGSLFGATMAATTLYLHFNGSIFGSFMTPSMAISHGSSLHTIANATLNVTDMAVWGRFAAAMVQSNTTAWMLSGSVDLSVHLGLFSVPISGLSLEKDMVLVGMHGLSTLAITQMDLTASTATSVVAHVETCLWNPSATALTPVGTLCLDVAYTAPGNVTAHVGRISGDASLNVTMTDASDSACRHFGPTGYNHLALTGSIVSSDPLVTSAMISTYLSGRAASVSVTACTPHATSIPLYNAALTNLSLHSTLPPNPVPLISDLAFEYMQVVPAGPRTVRLQTRVVVTANSPLGPRSPLVLTNMTMQLRLATPGAMLGALTSTSVVVHDALVAQTKLHLDLAADLALTRDGEPFGVFVQRMLRAPNATLALAGRFAVHATGALGTLHLADIPLLLNTPLQGMDGLSNVSVLNFSMPGVLAPEGEAFSATSVIWNPSVVDMPVGNVEMTLRTADEAFGVVSGVIAIAPGSNAIALTGHLKPSLDAHGGVSRAMNAFFSNYLAYKPSVLAIELTHVAQNVPWLQQALTSFTLPTTFPGVDTSFALVKSLASPRMHVVFTDDGEMHLQATLLALIAMPDALRLPVNITHLSLIADLVFENASVGHMHLPRQGVSYTELVPGAGHLEIDMPHAVALRIPDTSRARMAAFISATVFATDVVLLSIASGSMDGDGASPRAETPMGTLELSGIPLNGAMALQGMGGLAGSPVEIQSVDITRGTVSELYLSMTIAMRNPSQMAATLGDMLVDVSVDGQGRLGSARLHNVSLACCNASSLVAGSFVLAPSSAALADAFLSNFVSGYYTHGRPQTIHIHGTPASSNKTLLQPALSQLSLDTAVPPLPMLFPETPTLVASSFMYPPSIFHLLTVATALVLRNPFGHTIDVAAVDLELYPCKTQRKDSAGVLVCDEYYEQLLARFHRGHGGDGDPAKKHGGLPLVLPRDQVRSNCPGAVEGTCLHAEVASLLNPALISVLFKTMTTGLLMRVNGTLTANVNAFPMHMHYAQDGLLVTMA
ncbi:hypothetical protein SPRG_06453 [Saprolegnia parasitica CBS 223.65]|uniref:Uncharacterized protein n=1 Tax=Saprolegnia parasitica (strain CBS 223.65) TaxID=695850 RepID=A0A067CP63_SAPPC|nr:hypothetical protein SPRG_06453 [Saprolegnia parasitica CBS 223.65]KDO28597.1 hypothetical protein SPRG_06453 [Saprolegnia parasitica CBS 223.65]|eukprot:XP_012200660.1 hypothetical protein SPRG_06453 [Saprolegnia parasitica CBS 223.65]